MNSALPICPICHFGRLGERKITYTQVFEGKLVVIPNVSALVCDVCGERIVDDEVMTRLSGLLSQGRPAVRPATQRPT